MAGEADSFLLLIVAILFPPAAVAFLSGCGADLCLNILLTLIGYLPGCIHAFWLVIRRAEANERFGYRNWSYTGMGEYAPHGGVPVTYGGQPTSYGATQGPPPAPPPPGVPYDPAGKPPPAPAQAPPAPGNVPPPSTDQKQAAPSAPSDQKQGAGQPPPPLPPPADQKATLVASSQPPSDDQKPSDPAPQYTASPSGT